MEISKIVVACAIIIILILAFLFYFFTIKSVPLPEMPAEQALPTKVVKFTAPEDLPSAQKAGQCFASSIAQPFREDTFRCMVVNEIYDPCFKTIEDGFVYCQVNPLDADPFLISLTKPLPASEMPQEKQTNWAWFLKLENGTICSPFTGTRPFFGQGETAQIAYYGCQSKNINQQIVLLGDLIEGTTWEANMAILEKGKASWEIESTKKVEINTVWQ